MRHKRPFSILVASTNQGTIQYTCALNNKVIKNTRRKSYVLCCFGDKKPITKAEYDHYVSQGLESFVKIVYNYESH